MAQASGLGFGGSVDKRTGEKRGGEFCVLIGSLLVDAIGSHGHRPRDPQDYPQDYLFVSLLRNRGCGTCDSEITTGRAIGRSRYYLIISGIICQLKIVTGATHVRSNNSLRITLRTIGRHELVYAGEVRRPQGFRRKTSPSKGGLSSVTTFFPRPDRF